jgi:cholesterol transport system auxiliary component
MSSRALKNVAPLVLVSFLIAGCAGGLRSDAPPSQVYVLRATAAARVAADAGGSAVTRAVDAERASDGTAAAPSVQLPRPSADPGLATEAIVLVRTDRRMDSYLGSRWAADLPDVVETLAIDTLRASGAWAAVHESPSPFVADYLLQINIRRFEADYTGGGVAPRVFVVLDCTLARRIGRDLVATFVAEGAADARENKLSSVVAAFEEAANAALTTMADRSAAAARTTPPVASTP